MSRSVLLWIRDILIALIIALIIMQLIKPTIVKMHSMENTLHPNDYIFLSKQAYTFGEAKQGDIIVFESTETEENLIKRIIGLPGDTVSISDGNVFVNEVKQDEPYTKDGTTAGEMEEITVPEGSFFVLGDNRQSSRDSREDSVGFVSEDKVIGKAFFRLFPFNSFGTLK